LTHWDTKGASSIYLQTYAKKDNVPSNVLLGSAKREDTFKKYILARQQLKKEKIR